MPHGHLITEESLAHKVCFGVLFVFRFYGPVNPMGSCPVWSVYLTTFTGQALSSKQLYYCAHSFVRNICFGAKMIINCLI